jgi:murein DD-endopeptidase MepM/ murein hydrolase activator NlpD
VNTDPEPEAGGAVIVRPGQAGYSDGAYQDLPPDQAWQEMVDLHGWTVRFKRTAPRQLVYASYRPELPGPGSYIVEVFVPSARADTQAATYFISYYHGDERLERKVSLNQSLYYNQWAALGYFAFDPAQPDSGRVNLVDYSIEDPPRWIAFSAVRWRQAEPAQQTPPEPAPVRAADGFDPPVGTAEERAGQKLWPGFWKDAWHPKSGYARQYKDSAGNIAYHTGADLNLNEPRFNLDRGAPVYATAAGEVLFAGRVGNFWRNIIIIRHDPLPDGRQVYSRYGHVENMQVNVGDRVQRGQQICVVGSSGGANGNYHLHFDIAATDAVAEHPGHWPGTNLKGVLTHYLDPIEFIGKHRPGQV